MLFLLLLCVDIKCVRAKVQLTPHGHSQPRTDVLGVADLAKVQRASHSHSQNRTNVLGVADLAKVHRMPRIRKTGLAS